MNYICIYNQGEFHYYGCDEFKSGNNYIIGRNIPDPHIIFDPELPDMGSEHGKITSRYHSLYYTEFFNDTPTRFNNHCITNETFPISISGNIFNVFSFMKKGIDNVDNPFYYPAAFMFLSREFDIWTDVKMNGEDIIMGGSFLYDDVFLEETPHGFLTLIYTEAKDCYYLKVSEEARNKFLMITDDNLLLPLEETQELDFTVTYRFIYDNKYMFIIGGPVILYARI